MLTQQKYEKKILNKHFLLSAIYVQQPKLNKIQLYVCEVRAPKTQEYNYFLYLYYVLQTKPNRKIYNLSDSEKKFQKTSIKWTFFYTNLCKKLFYKTLSIYLQKHYFNKNRNHHLKEINGKFLKIIPSVNGIRLAINNLDVHVYNKSELFKILCTMRARNLNLKLEFKFQTKNINTMLLYLKIKRYISSVQVLDNIW